MDLPRALGVELPVIQAPMAGVQVSALAIAVAAAGGLGSLPCAMLEPTAIRREIGAIRAANPARPFNLNFFCHPPPLADPAREALWRSALAPYYREFNLDIAAVPAGGGRFPFDAAGGRSSSRSCARRSSASTSACPTSRCSAASARPVRVSSRARRRWPKGLWLELGAASTR